MDSNQVNAQEADGEAVNVKRVVNRLRIRLELPEHITDEEIVAGTKSSFSWAICALGIALDDFWLAIKQSFGFGG